MHSLLKELADFVSGEFCFRLEDKVSDDNQDRIFEKARHSSYVRGIHDGVTRFEAFSGVDYLRTFLALDPMDSIGFGVSYLDNRVPYDLLPKLRYLRVLSFDACRLTELPNSIGDLKHLRYLNLSRTAIKELPESTNTLFNLQTLNLSQCRNLSKLPSKLGNLKFLRHLCISGSRLREMPLQICELKNLQSLSNFVVGKDTGSGIKDLSQLSQIRGSLHISGLQNVDNFVDAIEANMREKQELDQLVLQWSNCVDDSCTEKDEEEEAHFSQHQDVSWRGYRETLNAYRPNPMELKLGESKILDDPRDERVEMLVLEMLQPHSNIKRVTIKDYGGASFPRWIQLPLFSDIKFLKLSNCMKCDNLPALGQLPCLKDLILDGIDRIKSIGIQFYADGQPCSSPFPSLEKLMFENMLNWEDWYSSGIEGREDFHYLQNLKIKNCPKLRKFSHCFPSLRKMKIKGCEQLVVLSMFSKFHNGVGESIEFPSLLKLSIRACPNLKELPSSFPSLTVLKIDGCQNLTELPHLPLIRDLELSDCNVGSLKSIIGLKSLSFLRLCQILELTCIPEGFFENLTSLADLHIANMSDLTTLSNNIGLHKIPCLQRMEISGCTIIEELPQSLYKFPYLKELKVWQCPSFVSFPITGLPSSLLGLEIKDCEALQSLPTWKMHNKRFSVSLEYLKIKGCSSLAALPEDKLPKTLKELEIHDCIRLQSLPKQIIQNSPYLEFLNITGCDSITHFHKDAFQLPVATSSIASSLKQLIINGCAKLKSLPDGLHNLVNLDHLKITDCPVLLSFPEVGLPLSSLRSIRLSNCESLMSFPNHMRSLTSLEGLYIENCSRVSSFPEGGLPVNLISLTILDCDNLKPSFQWGLHRLTRLTDLAFGGCKDLVSFPDDWLLPKSLSSLQLQRLPSLKRLPNGLKNLYSLDNLEIWECDRLKIDKEPPLMGFDFWHVI